ncbi:MAG: N-acetylmuramoyl-L-alanine amidase [Balneola sp.]
MKKLKLALCITFVLVNLKSIYSQEVSMPSPTAANLGSYAEHGINLYNGIPNIQVPITSVGGHDISVNIFLTYDASGVKVSQVPDWVGSGWALHAGGVITRSQKGLPDETNSKGFISSTAQEKLSYLKSKLPDNVPWTSNEEDEYDDIGANGYSAAQVETEIETGIIDGEPDVFYYNFSGGSGKFILDPDASNKGITIPQSDFRIDYAIGSGSVGSKSATSITEFTVTTPNGVKYIFDKMEFAQRQPGDDITKLEPASAWYLTKIESAMGDSFISFSYSSNTNDSVIVHKYNNEEYENTAPSSDPYFYQFHTPNYLEEITYKNTTITFKRASRLDAQPPSEWQEYPKVVEKTKRLSEIEIKKDGQLVKEFILTPLYDSNNNRLFLSQIQEFDGYANPLPSHKFEYDNVNNLPDRFSKAIDHWGYYNGKTDYNSSRGFISRGVYFSSGVGEEVFFDGANRSIDTQFSKFGVLNKITFPTGGSVEYEYEQNVYSETIIEVTDNVTNFNNAISIENDKSLSSINEIESETFSDQGLSPVYVEAVLNYKCNGEHLDYDRLYIDVDTSPSTQTNQTYININRTMDTQNEDTWRTCSEFESGRGIQLPDGYYKIEEDIYPLNVGSSSSNTYNFYFRDENTGQQEDSGTPPDEANIVYSVYGVPAISAGNKNAPGLRVKSLTIDDGDSNTPVVQKHYEYTLGISSASTGKMFSEPIYLKRYFDPTNPSATINLGVIAVQQFSFGMGDNGFAGYESVTEKIGIGNGKTVTSFYQNEELTDSALARLDDYEGYYAPIYGKNPNTMSSLYFGKPYDVTTYTPSEGEITQKIFTENDTDDGTHAYRTIFAGALDTKIQGTNGYARFQPYVIAIPFLANTKVESRVFDDSGTFNFTTTETEYEGSSHKNPTKVTETNSLSTEERITEYEYAHEVTNDGDSPVLNYSDMEDLNMLTQLYMITTKKGSAIINKEWTRWSDQISGNSNWLPEEKWVATTSTPSYYPTTSIAEQSITFSKYDAKGNPLEVIDAKDVKTSYDWSEDGSTPLGIFKNADKDEVFAHSFAFDRFENWIFIDEDSDGDTDTTISNGKLKLTNYGSASNLELDRLYYDHGSEITSNIVWEFDIKIDDSDGSDLQINTGNVSWNGGSTHSAVWSAIKNEEWRTHDGSGWVSIKTGLMVGKTYVFKIVMDPVSDEADYYVDGVRLKENISFRDVSISGIQKFAFGNYGYGTVTTEWYIDNVRMYPEGAQASSQEVNPLFMTPVAMKDAAGATSRYEYDDFGRLTKAYNTNGELVTTNSYYFSLEGTGSYNVNNPNRVESWTHYDPNNSSNVTKSVQYMDGIGRSIQTQVRGGSSTIITDTRFNDRGLPEVTSRPYEISNQTTYKQYGFEGDSTGLFTPGNALPSNSPIEDEYQSLPSNDEDYSYSQVQYENTPLARTEKSTLPGPNHTISSTQAIETTYGLNTTETFATSAQGSTPAKTWAVNTLNKTITEDPSGKKTISYTNGWGETIASGVDMNSDNKLTRSSSDLVTEFAYDLRGNLVRVEDPRGLPTTYTYNQLGQLTSKKLPDQEYSVSYRYDEKGRLRFIQDPNQKSTSQDISHSLSGSTSVSKTIVANSAGTLELDFCVADLFMDDYTLTIKRIESNTTVYSNTFTPEGDCVGSPSSPLTFSVSSGTYTFTGQAVDSGEPIISTSGTFGFVSNDIFTYTKYDDMDRPIETGEYSGGTTFSGADPDTDSFPASGHQANVQYFYDGDQSYSGTHSVTSRNLASRLTKVSYRDLSVSGSSWGHSWYSYNSLGLVEWIVQDLPGLAQKKIEYNYDELGRLTQMDYQAGESDDFYQRYTYDALGRMTKVETSTDGSSWTKDAEYTSYLADGQVAQLKLGNSNIQTIDYAYTVQGWLDKINNGSISTGTNGDRFGMNLDYDFNGNIDLQEWRQVGTTGTNQNLLTYSYSYDNANRLTAANFSGSGYNSSAFDLEWMNYDDNGNITGYLRRDNNGNIGYDGIGYFGMTYETGTNRIDKITEQVDYLDFDIDHDASGNMTKNILQGFTSVDYDWRNLPAQLIKGANTLQYAYDAEGNRVKKKMGSTETHYVRGAGGETIAIYQADTLLFHNILAGADIIGNHKNGARKYFLKDHLGSVRTTIDESGEVVGYSDYYPFGLLMPTRNGRSGSLTEEADKYKFTGHERDEEADLTLDYMMARNYDPIIGRFLQIDPLVDSYPGWSPYNYAFNNPINWIDPTGMGPDKPYKVKKGVLTGTKVKNDITSKTKRPKMSGGVQGIVLHRTVSSSASSAINASKNSKGRVGFHVVVDTDGTLTQLNNFEDRANHVGKPTGKINNNNSIGIEVVGMSVDADGNPTSDWRKTEGWEELTDEQIENTAKLVNTLMDEYGLGMNDIFPHEDVSRKQEGEGRTVLDAIKPVLEKLRNSSKEKK